MDSGKCTPDTEDEDVAKLLRVIGPRKNPPEATTSAWSEVFRSELDKVIARRRHRRLAVAGICAGFLILVVTYTALIPREATRAPAIAKLSGQAGIILADEKVMLLDGITYDVKAGEKVETVKGSYARLAYGGADVRINEESAIRVFDGKLELLFGEIYVATNSVEGKTILVAAGSAIIRNRGTQFLVANRSGSLIARVRKGSIIVAIDSDEHVAKANGVARTLEVLPTGQVRILDTAPHGESWDWILNLTEDFTLEGQTAYDFLRWSTSETGHRLVFENPQTERMSKTIVLHGDIKGVKPEKAVEVVLATTRLEPDITVPNNLIIRLRKEWD